MLGEVIEVPCPHCGVIQNIPEHAVPPSGEVACAACGESIRFRAAGPQVTGAFRVGGSPLPPPSRRPLPLDPLYKLDTWDTGPDGEPFDKSFSIAAPAPENSRPSQLAKQVRCPECGHHFDPASAIAVRPTVLVVEDTEFFLHLATQTLARHYDTVGVRTASEAQQVLRERTIHLILLDLTLPDAEGTEVLRALPQHDLPVLIYTSRDETTLLGPTWTQLQALGARDVVHKGINIEDALLKKTHELLSAASPARR